MKLITCLLACAGLACASGIASAPLDPATEYTLYEQNAFEAPVVDYGINSGAVWNPSYPFLEQEVVRNQIYDFTFLPAMAIVNTESEKPASTPEPGSFFLICLSLLSVSALLAIHK